MGPSRGPRPRQAPSARRRTAPTGAGPAGPRRQTLGAQGGLAFLTGFDADHQTEQSRLEREEAMGTPRIEHDPRRVLDDRRRGLEVRDDRVHAVVLADGLDSEPRSDAAVE